MAIAQAPSMLTPPYICLSSDTKPATAQAGQRLYETDTNTWYVWNGSSWVNYYGG